MNQQTAITCGCIVALMYLLRCCPLWAWVLIVAIPALVYALFAERTKKTKIYGKTVLVTYACSGLGKALAIEACRKGARKVLLVSDRKAQLKEATQECNDLCSDGNNKHPKFEAFDILLNVCDPEATREASRQIYEEHGVVDVLVNNAGGASSWKSLESTTPEEAMAMMACPYLSAFTCTTLFVPAMVEFQTGHVLNVTSAASEIGFSGAVGYASARWAMRGFSRVLLWDLQELGIGVTHMNAAEVSVTSEDHAKNRPGWLSRTRSVVDALGVNYTTQQVAAVGLSAVERGWSNVQVPGHILIPTKCLVDWVPFFVEYIMYSMDGNDSKRD